MKRRDFLGFFLLGGFLSLLGKKIVDKKLTFKKEHEGKKAMFWKKRGDDEDTTQKFI